MLSEPKAAADQLLLCKKIITEENSREECHVPRGLLYAVCTGIAIDSEFDYNYS